jgi:hypothetical protein
MSQSQYMQGSTGQRNEIINEALGIHKGGKHRNTCKAVQDNVMK